MDWIEEAKAAALTVEERPSARRTLAETLHDVLGVTAAEDARVHLDVDSQGVFRLLDDGTLFMEIPLPDGSHFSGPVSSSADAGRLMLDAQNRARQM